MSERVFKVGDEVAFSMRCQTKPLPMVVDEIDRTLFGDRVHVKNDPPWIWWCHGNFMPFSEWRKL